MYSSNTILTILSLFCVLGLPSATFAALLRNPVQDGYGKLLHIQLASEEFLDVFAVQLRAEAVKRGEIMKASDWDNVPLGICEGGRDGCSEVNQHASELNQSAWRRGYRLPQRDLGLATRRLLEQFDVDIFFHTTQLGYYGSMYAQAVLENGPAATLEATAVLGEQRFFSSVLTLLMSLRKTILVMSFEGDAKLHLEFGRTFEKTIRKHAQRRPLMYCWTKDNEGVPCDMLTRYPSVCTVRSRQYWGNASEEIHATPDAARASGETALSMPVMIAHCHAPPNNTQPSYILYYDNSHDSKQNMSRAALISEATGLPVQVLAKRSNIGCGAGGAGPKGVHCIGRAEGVEEFHAVLQQARLLVAPVAAQDNPALIEATACGTPVLVERGQHKMLERFGQEPHVVIWDDWEGLRRGLKQAMVATQGGKLQSWVPRPLQFPVMLKRMDALLSTAREKCDSLT